MNVSFNPIYKLIFRRRNLLIEKLKSDYYKTWKNHIILEFGSSTFLATTDFFQTNALSSIYANKGEYFSVKLIIKENIGLSDGKEFLDWIDSFYDKKNNYYRFNIYDNYSKDINFYSISKSMKKIKKFQAISCVIKNPLFFEGKNNILQFGITISTSNQIRESFMY